MSNNHPGSHLPPSVSLRHLGQISGQYARMADDYGPIALAAAEAEAAHKATKARHKLASRAAEVDPCRTDAEAETRADADETIATLYHRRLTTRAIAESHLEKLRQLRTQVEVGRSYVASERAADAATAPFHP